jgi:hypothetical protein
MSYLIKDELFVCKNCVTDEVILSNSNPAKKKDNSLKWKSYSGEIKPVMLASTPYRKARIFLKFLHENRGNNISLCDMRKNIVNGKYHQILKMAKKLEKSGIIIKGKDNRNIYYKINSKLKKLENIISFIGEKRSAKNIQNIIISFLSKNVGTKFTIREIAQKTKEQKTILYYNLNTLVNENEIKKEKNEVNVYVYYYDP